jgi:hypothetical protein
LPQVDGVVVKVADRAVPCPKEAANGQIRQTAIASIRYNTAGRIFV